MPTTDTCLTDTCNRYKNGTLGMLHHHLFPLPLTLARAHACLPARLTRHTHNTTRTQHKGRWSRHSLETTSAPRFLVRPKRDCWPCRMLPSRAPRPRGSRMHSRGPLMTCETAAESGAHKKRVTIKRALNTRSCGSTHARTHARRQAGRQAGTHARRHARSHAKPRKCKRCAIRFLDV